MFTQFLRQLTLAAACWLTASCITPVQQRAGVLEFLYPEGTNAEAPRDVHLRLPARVGIAFVPATARGRQAPPRAFDEYEPLFDPQLRHEILDKVAATFRATPGVASIDIVPDVYLEPGGGFANVDRLRALLGIDLLALISYEQSQTRDMNRWSLAYLTLVGGAFAAGNEHDTHTLVDISVFAVEARALLFRAAGHDRVQSTSTALAGNTALRDDGRAGLTKAIGAATTELAAALASFREQAKSGTVRGPGTPQLQVTGAGALGGFAAALSALAIAFGAVLRRRTCA